MFLLISGNPVDGLKYYGPFKTYLDAAEAADALDDNCWVTQLIPPTDEIFK